MRPRVAIATVVVSLLLVTSAPSAGANPIGGSRYWGDGNYHVMPSQVSVGNMVGFWQAFLLAYNQIPCSRLDGHYGSQTAAGTRNIQAFFRLRSDGIAGRNTLNAASHWLHSAGSDGFATTYWAPNFGSGPYWPLYAYVFGGGWYFEVPHATDPFEVNFNSNHPAIGFANAC